jgi:hypothetical protein
MQSMPDLIDSIVFRFYEFSVFKGLLFKKKAYVISRFLEVILKVVISGFGIEDRELLRSDFKISDKMIDLLDRCLTLLWGNKAGNDCITFFHVMLYCFGNHRLKPMEKSKRK